MVGNVSAEFRWRLLQRFFDRPDDALAFSVLPGRIAFPPILNVGPPVFDKVVLLAVGLEFTVEIRVCQEILRRVNARLQEVLAGPGELKMVLSDPSTLRSALSVGMQHLS